MTCAAYYQAGRMVCDLCGLDWAAVKIVAPECGLYPKRTIRIPKDDDAIRFRVPPARIMPGTFPYVVDAAFDDVGDIAKLVEEYS